MCLVSSHTFQKVKIRQNSLWFLQKCRNHIDFPVVVQMSQKLIAYIVFYKLKIQKNSTVFSNSKEKFDLIGDFRLVSVSLSVKAGVKTLLSTPWNSFHSWAFADVSERETIEPSSSAFSFYSQRTALQRWKYKSSHLFWLRKRSIQMIKKYNVCRTHNTNENLPVKSSQCLQRTERYPFSAKNKLKHAEEFKLSTGTIHWTVNLFIHGRKILGHDWTC